MEIWRKRAACLEYPASWFFPERINPGDQLPDEEDDYPEVYDTLDEDRARQVCAVCPVVESCLRFAVENNERSGIWGTGGDRRRYLRRLYVKAMGHNWETIPLRWEKSWSKYNEAIQVEIQTIRGEYERPVQERHDCERCKLQGFDGWIAEGAHPEDRNSPGAKCGFAVTYARGCRCTFCKVAHMDRSRRQKQDKQPPIQDESTEEDTCRNLIPA